MNSFLDTSVLIPVFLSDHLHHAASLDLYTECSPDTACCASHTLAEVYSTLTRLPLPHRATPAQAIECLESMRTRLSFVSLPGNVYYSTIREAAARGVSGGTIYDALIAKCALQAKADHIFT